MKTAIILSIICVAVLVTAYGPRHGRNTAGEKAEIANFSKPDEVREFPKGRLELIKIGGATVGRAIFQPGWKWSTSL
ncbi:MAG TPA: hypothetical protein VGD17_10140, partial [Chitinophagaceae bacterium]